jgi:hypothetical protein
MFQLGLEETVATSIFNAGIGNQAVAQVESFAIQREIEGEYQ